jgi:hypothetical protein
MRAGDRQAEYLQDAHGVRDRAGGRVRRCRHRAPPDPFEVADIFEVPLDFLADEANHQRQSREFQGKLRHFYAMLWDERTIWGATAGMLVNLAEILREAR